MEYLSIHQLLSNVEAGYEGAWRSNGSETTRRYIARSHTREVVRFYASDVLTVTFVEGTATAFLVNTGVLSTDTTRRRINAALQRYNIKARVYRSQGEQGAVPSHVLRSPQQTDRVFHTVCEYFLSPDGSIRNPVSVPAGGWEEERLATLGGEYPLERARTARKPGCE